MPTVAPLDLDGHCVAAAFVDDIPFFALADGMLHWLDHGHQSLKLHDGLLSATTSAKNDRLISGGEDGKVMGLTSAGVAEELAGVGRKWVTSVAAGPQGALAYASGRSAWVRFADGKVKEFVHPRSVEGVAFSPKGMRIGVARYNGATLHFPAADGKPTELQWDGAHTGITFSPDGNFLVTTMQENALHGWKLADGKHMRMTGYPAKVKSMSWSAKGRWLASSGAPAAIVWPFQSKDGPMGKAPLELGTRGNLMVTAVACHPTDEIAAIGYADGMVLAARFADQKEVLLRRPGKGAITSLAWDKEGRRIAFGSEPGDCGVVDITA
jgi:WD40 repeat protein